MTTTHTHYLWFETKRRQEIIDITDQVAEQVAVSQVSEGHPDLLFRSLPAL